MYELWTFVSPSGRPRINTSTIKQRRFRSLAGIKTGMRPRSIGRSRGALGSPAAGWPLFAAGQFEYLFRLSKKSTWIGLFS